MQDYKFDYNEYKRKVRSSIGISIYLLIFFAVVLLGVIYFIKPKKNVVSNFYFVEVNNFLKYFDANALSAEIQARNGAGYIYFDSSYHVLAGYYLNQQSAQQVCNNIKEDYPTAKVFSIECANFKKHKNLTDKQNQIVFEIIEKNLENVENLYENIVNFDKNDINIDDLKNFFNNLSTDYEQICNKFFSNFSENSKYIKSKQNINNINSCIKELSDCVNNNQLYKLKYNLIKIVVEHNYFVSCF